MTRIFAITALALAACKGGSSHGTSVDAAPDAFQVVEGACQIAAGSAGSAAPDDLNTITCMADFSALASLPLDADIPSATSAKVVLDQADSDHLYIQNSVKYQIHYQFCSTHLSGNGLPIVPDLATFNATEYFSPDRRFILGAITYYALPDKWVLELSPYDTASADMIQKLFDKVKDATYFGPELAFHPTSDALAAVAATLPSSIPIITTDQLYAGIDFQPLSAATGVGTLHFTTVANLDAGEFYSPYDILVLDSVPNDLSVVQGTITQDFQTPLAHINVLAHTRHTPNMGLRDALSDPTLTQYAEQLVKLTVTAESWTVEPMSLADAQAYWAANAPAPVTLPAADLSVTAVADMPDVTPVPAGSATLAGNLSEAIKAYGGKAAHYAVLYNTPGMPTRPGFAIPIYYYDQFMRENGFYDRVSALLADPTFTSDPATRSTDLAQLQADMLAAPIDGNLQLLIKNKLATAPWSGYTSLKFRSSSNSEDISGFPCAGCYDSYGASRDDLAAVLTAIKSVWASAWEFRAFELRSYYGVDHLSVGMGILCHESFPDEAANGVAITANPFDASGLDPAFYINAQQGGTYEVTNPTAGIDSDEFLYYFTQPNQPISFISHSNIIPAGTTVLTTAQTYELGEALTLVNTAFSDAYGPGAGNSGWYAMDVEWKLDNEDDPSSPPKIYIKQARPYAAPDGASQ